jgi:hypothetical protein
MPRAWLERALLLNTPAADGKLVDTSLLVQTPPRTSFLDLPYEIRRAIYCYFIPRRTTFNIRFYPRSLYAAMPHSGCLGNGFRGLLLVCRQVSDEALDILYGENAFEVVMNLVGQNIARPMFPQSNRRRIRHVLLLHPCRYYSHGGPVAAPLTIDSTLWDPIFPTLKTMIIADDSRTVTANQVQIEPYARIVRYIGNALPAECIVLFDFNQVEWVERLFRENLPHQSRPVQIATDVCDPYRTSVFGGSTYWRIVLPILRQ